MLPSSSRLSRSEFTCFCASRDTQTVFNRLGTLKYANSSINKASVVISSKIEKRAVFRNKLRRRLYMEFNRYFKSNPHPRQYVLYISKQAPTLEFIELKTLMHELFHKITQ